MFQSNGSGSEDGVEVCPVDMSCKNLDCDVLELLLVQVDKENSIKFLFNYYILLIHILYLLLFIESHTSPLSHSLLYVHYLFN